MPAIKKWVLILITTVLFCSDLSARYFQFNGSIHSTGFYKTVFRDSFPANVHRLNLSQNVIFINCDSKEQRCSENKEQIDIWTEAFDRFGNSYEDRVVYNYTVSGGQIIGEGEKVIWDLSNAEPGEYTITAGVDDGCGVCGETKTRTVYVVECPKISGEGYPRGVVNSINTDRAETFEVCQLSSKKQRKSCSDEEGFIKVSTLTNIEDELKTIYKYDVTGGRIIGNGANVEWDLSKAEPGTYVVTASVDVGYGFCSESKSVIVKVVECSRCKKKKKKEK